MLRVIMKRMLLTFGIGVGLSALAFLLGILWPLDVPMPNQRLNRVLIRDVAVVDIEAGAVLNDRQILIGGSRILAVGEDLDDRGAQVLSMAGRFAIPGLFDMHVHSIKMSPTLTHPLFVAAGVTAVRDMGGCIGIEDAWVACAEDKRSWNAAVENARMVGPRFDQVTSLAINGGAEIPGGLDRALGAATPASARMRAEYDAARGIDFLKPYTMIPRDGYFALARAAAENNLYLAGHLPLAVSGLEAIRAGQRSIEHAFLFIWDCYPGMAEQRAAGNARAVYTTELRQRMIAEHDAQLCSRLHDSMVAADTAFVPTHTTRKLDAFAMDQQYRADPRLRYIPAPLRALWLEDANGMAARAGEDGTDSYREFYAFGIRQTGAAHRAGVTILAGTDAPDSFAFPGSGLHDELEHLVEAGLSPLDALRSATTEPARFLGLNGVAGVIKAGARADIVFLNSDPLADVGAVREIDTVVLAGVVYNRSDLDGLLDGIEDAAGSWTMWPKFAWQMIKSPIMRRQFGD